MKQHTKLTFPERKLIARWLKEGVSLRRIAFRLGRSHSTVVRERKRNSFKRRVYEPLHAQNKAEARKTLAWKAKQPLKNPGLYAYVTERLRWGWSPEVISGRLKKVEHPNDSGWQICPETIYRFCYQPRLQKENFNWWEYLRRKQKRRRKQNGRSVHRVRIPDRVSIHDRPKVIDQRTEFGHWEGDTLVGLGRNHGLHTAYERLCSLVRMEKMPDLTATSSLKAQKIIYGDLPPLARKSITLDNGHEHILHARLKETLGIQTYFADPYSSWQRGGNENANLWIRYYFPKGTDFRIISQEELKDVEDELNNRPRKRLGYQTPLEVFNTYLVVQS